jgi:Asp-tRNA(Asn)/Glu-tRNA(Gln) amidotransferase A subunit family amidase
LLVEALRPPSPLKLAEAEAVATQLKSNFKNVMDTQVLDAIMYPWAGHAPVLATLASLPIVRIRGLQFAEAQCAAPFKFKKDGSPFGVIFVARPGAEATLLQVM